MTNTGSGALPGCGQKRRFLFSGVPDGEPVRSRRLGYVQRHCQLVGALPNAISEGRLVQVWDVQGGNVAW